MTITTFLVTLGAVARLNRLAIDDGITEPIRMWIARGQGGTSRRARTAQWFTQLLSCPWCIGFWLSLAVVSLAGVSHGAGWFFWPALVLTVSWLAAIAHMGMYELEGEVHDHDA